ncbi:translation initiation factor eIF-2B subunit epsilon isoform X1 [Oryza brachyantha]|uniref:Translation initiation factor eIF2B subunit epsilon n=1 Tax=Oryza brachyantha TaxID=4533 RepID=J3LI92_ORYBR|nr:translation initiation factor eIF-2B subunit epsilon isoform X1 [Oryza brachyantha]
MSQKKSRGGGGGAAAGEDPEDLSRSPLQAVLLADSFTLKFRPITLERPKVLLPLVNVPMIEYTLSWLESAGVEEVFVFCCAHAQQVKEHLAKAGWTGKAAAREMTVTAVESHDAISAGDALRVMYGRGVIHGDFVLISGDTISNMNLQDALQEHKDRRKKDPLAVMTMIIKHSKPSILTHQTRLGNDEIVMAIDPETKELLYYEDRADGSSLYVTIDKHILASNPTLQLCNNMEDCYIDICSPEVLSLFTDNFDYQHLRRHFVKGLLVDDIMGYKIYTHEIRSSYAARIDNFRSYDTVSKDIIQRWTYPMVPDVLSFGDRQEIKLHRQGIYKASDVTLSHSAQIGANSVIGNATSIGENCKVSNSVIGEGCNIGKNVLIHGSYIWDNVIIEDGCKVSNSLICDGVHLRAGATVEPGCILSFKVEVGKNVVVPAYSKVSLLPQPSNEDSDEELEYADTNSGVTDSPPFSSMRSADHPTVSDDDDLEASETGTCGVAGYIWANVDTGVQEEWRQSIGPIPKDKLKELQHAASFDDDDDGSEDDLNNRPTVLDQDDDSDVSVAEDDDYSKFEKEVEETFQRALDGIHQDNLILEINALRLSYSLQHADCAGALFHSVMRSALVAAQSTNGSLLKTTAEALGKWKDLLRNYTKSVDEEMEILLKFEEMCQENAKEFSPLFSKILPYLYDKEVVSEDAILRWAEEKENADESDKVFVKQSEAFIQWLKEAEEEDEEEE